jgi:hypothetical protein
MKHLLAVALLLSSLRAVAQNEAETKAMYPRMAKAQAYEAKGFHSLDCFAGQVRIRGKRLSRQSFSVFRSGGDMKCCGEKVAVGRTDMHGHFLLEPLTEGEYFAVFDSDGTQYTVSFAVIEGYQRCAGTHVELNFTAANQCSLQAYADLDDSETDCSEDSPACYRK